MNDKVKGCWEDPARTLKTSPTATTVDVYLRELEIDVIVKTIQNLGVATGDRVLDLGCENGYSTLKVAEQLAGETFEGIDYSEGMIEAAKSKLDDGLKGRVSFRSGDARRLSNVVPDESFFLVLGNRCLTNLGSPEEQVEVIGSIEEVVYPGGYLLAIEHFQEGHDAMNEARTGVGLPEIPVRWHNLFFSEDVFREAAEPHFELVRFVNSASAYYYAACVVYSAMCQMRGEEPDYQHEIHMLNVRLPLHGNC